MFIVFKAGETRSCCGTAFFQLSPMPSSLFSHCDARGDSAREGCEDCHTLPHCTNYKLTTAEGFQDPDDHFKRYDILPISIGTGYHLALKTRPYGGNPCLLGLHLAHSTRAPKPFQS